MSDDHSCPNCVKTEDLKVKAAKEDSLSIFGSLVLSPQSYYLLDLICS